VAQLHLVRRCGVDQMKALGMIAYTGFAVAVIALPFFVYNWLAYVIPRARAEPHVRPQIRKPIRSILFFMIPVIVGLVVGETSKLIGHHEVLRALESFRDDYQLRINGKSVQNPDQTLAILKTLHWIFPHHSHSTRRIDVEVSNHSQRLLLWVSRDSDDPREYWVFYPKYLVTAHNEVGRVVTPSFDAY
jgi:hypothetical protein